MQLTKDIYFKFKLALEDVRMRETWPTYCQKYCCNIIWVYGIQNDRMEHINVTQKESTNRRTWGPRYLQKTVKNCPF